MRLKLIILLFVVFMSSNYSQQLLLRGTVRDQSTRKELSYANVRVQGTTIGTSANIEGNFELRLNPDDYTLIISFIGYKSDTMYIPLYGDRTIEMELTPITILLPQVTVLPGANPAFEIIRRAIETKHKRQDKLNNYIYHAFTKGVIRTESEVEASGNTLSVGLSGGESDSTEMKIFGILENESKGYFKKPDYFKEEIISRKQSANFPSSANVFAGGRLIQNFYMEDINFSNREILGPLSDDALDYYYYYVEDTLAYDKYNVFQIYFEPDDKSDPGFVGRLFIIDSLFSLAKVDAGINDAANPGGIFTDLRFFQQFLSYDDEIYMPIDFRLLGGIAFLGLVRLDFEVNSIIYNYEINTEINDDFFDMAVITVSPEADKRDSSYWQNIQSIPNTGEEVEAYQRIDSVEAAPKSFWDRLEILSNRLYLSDNFAVRGPLWWYHFNRVEGNTIDFGLYLDDLLDKRLNAGFDIGYGFADKNLKTEFSSRYYLGKYRTTRITLNAFNKMTDLFGESIQYNLLTSTLLNLISKYDFRDYYYTKGFKINLASEIFPVLQLGIGFINRTDNSAFTNTNFSFFNKNKTYRENTSIYETKVNAVTANFRFDFRKYIEDGYRRNRISQGKSYVILSGEALFSNSGLFKSNSDFQFYTTNVWAVINTIKYNSMSVDIDAVYSNGAIPFQMMYALQGNINASGKRFSYRTLRIGEYFGDRVLSVKIQQDLGDELFRLSGIPILKDLQLQLGVHANMALLDISEKSKNILPVTYKTFKQPFYEAGFSIGHILFPLRFEFTWKLNHRDGNNFEWGINAFVL